MKRPRGRPRKHPLPIHLQQLALNTDDSYLQSSSGGYRTSPTMMMGQTPLGQTALGQSSSGLNAVGPRTSDSKTKKSNRVSKYLEYRQRLYSSDILDQLQILDSLPPQIEVAEEYYGFGGPYSFLSLGSRVQALHDICNEEKEEQSKQVIITQF